MSQGNNHWRVLVVDDEHVIAETLALILNQHGFEATPVYSGEVAIETAALVRPDVVISDVIMGGMNGIEVAIRISALYPDCRIILISGQIATAYLIEDAKNTHNRSFEVLPKPVRPQDLIDLLNAFQHEQSESAFGRQC